MVLACSQQMLGHQIRLMVGKQGTASHFHSSGRNANVPYLKRELIFADKAGNRLYKEWLVNGKIALASYNRDGELIADDIHKIVASAKRAGAFGTKKVKRVPHGTGNTSWAPTAPSWASLGGF